MYVTGDGAVFVNVAILDMHISRFKVKVRLHGSEDFTGIIVDENNVEVEISGDMTSCVLVRVRKIF